MQTSPPSPLSLRERRNTLTTQTLTIGYRTHVIARALALELHAGELVCVIGPNGAGKSTLLRTLAGMQAPLAGHVLLGADDVHRLPPRELAKRLAVVLTERVEVGNLSAYALTALGRHPYTDWHGRLTTQDEAAVRQALIRTGAAQFAARPVNELSDGERQRVMIARALAQEPQVLILDEPTAFLDLRGRVEIVQLLARLAHETQCAILLSTHDLELALRVADRLWLIASDGTLTTGLPEELALNGALADVFHSEGVEFDNTSGAFKLRRQPCGPILVRGSGLAADWTARALERIGYHVAEAAPLVVEVNAEGWRVSSPQRQRNFASLAELVEALRQSP